MRFIAPPRAAIPPARFAHPVFEAFAARLDLLQGETWPGLDQLNSRLGGGLHGYAGKPLAFVPQTSALLGDGLHYEARIWQSGQIATREQNWHDLFNALMWLDRRALKSAVNAAYVAELKRALPGQRTRAQAALTHFDEAGALVLLGDPGLLHAWDVHDWQTLFFDRKARWQAGADVLLFGHALLEHALLPDLLPVAKCLVIELPPHVGSVAAMQAAADAIAAGKLLRDPQELRPLPLAGLPGWHAGATSRRFFEETPCFRQVRPGRRYPAAWLPPAGVLQVAGQAR